KKSELSARTNRYPMIPIRNSLTTLTIVSADGEGLAPIRCSSSALTSASKDQNRYAARSAAAEAARNRISLLVERGRAIRVIRIYLWPNIAGNRLISIKRSDRIVTRIAVSQAAIL